PPSVDSFYQPPADYVNLSPGTLLRSRQIPSPQNVGACTRVFQLLYRSQDATGAPTAGVSTVFVPGNASSLDKIISVQSAYDSTDIDCSPSYTLRTNPTSLGEFSEISSFLSRGWSVSVPDFEGFFAAFGNGLQAGYSTLDSIRAVLQSGNITNLDPTANVALVGGSGGAIGSEFALELVKTYAAELQSQIVGALLMALVPDVNSTIYANDGTTTSGLIPLVLQGLAKQYLSFANWLSGVLLSDQAAGFFGATTECGEQFAISYVFRQSSSYLTSTSVFQDAIPQQVFQETGTMGLRGTPSQPMFYYKGTLDTLSPIAPTDALIQKYCEGGANIIYQRCTNCDHGLASYGVIAGSSWLEDRLNGIPAATGCTIS
ncbi:LIP-domain-containing protein, partial [Coniochaeta ligniaria NRRL 30616]